MAIRITGLNSGLDTEALVSELVSAYRVKSQKYTKAQTKLSWKQDAWKSLNTKINSFYKSLDNYRFSNRYVTKKASVSDSTKASVSVSSSAVNGTQSLEITEVAKAGYLTGANLGSGITGSSSLADLGINTAGTLSVTAEGKKTNISVNGDTTINELVDSMNKAGVKASFDSANHRFFISSSVTGKDHDFSLTAGDANGISALTSLGLNVKSGANIADYEAFAEYALNTDGSQYFIKNGDGTYSTNGTYSEEKTKASIEEIRQNAWDKSTQNTNLTADIAYANAYKGVEDIKKVFDSGSEAGNWDLLTNLLNRSDTSSIFVDDTGRAYKVTQNEDGTYTGTYTEKTTDADGNEVETEKTVSLTKNGDTRYTYTDDSGNTVNIEHGAIRLAQLEEAAGLATLKELEDGSKQYEVKSDEVAALKNNLSVKNAFEADAANSAVMQTVKEAYDGTAADGKDIAALTAEWNTTIQDNATYINRHKILENDTDTADALTAKVEAAVEALKNPSYNVGASRVDGTDAVIKLNGAEFTSSTNQFEINGMSINTLAKTDGEITITTDNDASGLFDKVKEFITSYNSLINEMTSLYNADSAKGYEPLTDEEKDSMTDTEVEKWEAKIKDSLLRRDGTLDSVLSAMETSMLKSYTVNGKTYSLASFGISTLGIFDSPTNQQNAYHINGDEDDASVAAKDNTLMSMLKSDPNTVIDFMQQLTMGLYDALDKKMGSTSMSTKYVVYNDKEMASEYSDYTDTIKKWEEKLSDLEDYYYKKFSAMETALAKLQSQQSSLANLLG